MAMLGKNGIRSAGRFFAIGLACTLFGCKTPEGPKASELAQKDFNSGDWSKAVVKYSQAITKEGKAYQFSFNRGICYREMGRNKDAIADFGDAMTLNSNDNGKAAFERAKLLLDEKRFASAIKDADLILELNPQNTEAKLIKGLALYEVKQYEESAEFLSSSMKVFSAKSNKGMALRKALAKGYLKQGKIALTVKARTVYMEYFNARKDLGILDNDDNYWAGVMADINLDNVSRDRFWSKLPIRYKRAKGIK